MASRKLYVDLAASLKIDLERADEDLRDAETIAYVIRTTVGPALKRDNASCDLRRFFIACGLTENGELSYFSA